MTYFSLLVHRCTFTIVLHVMPFNSFKHFLSNQLADDGEKEAFPMIITIMMTTLLIHDHLASYMIEGFQDYS